MVEGCDNGCDDGCCHSDEICMETEKNVKYEKPKAEEEEYEVQCRCDRKFN